MEHLHIRTARPADLTACAAIESACFPPEQAARREDLRQRLAAYPDHILVGERQGAIAGYIMGPVIGQPYIEDNMFTDPGCHDPSGPYQSVFSLAVLPAFQHRGLGGQLIDLSAQTIHLPLELLVLGGECTVALLGLGQLRGIDLCRLGTGVRRGGLQALVLLLQRLHLRGQLGDLGVQAGNIRTERLRGLAALHGLTAQRFNGFGDLIQEVVDLVDIIAFLQANGSERMLPNVLRRQQSHKSCTSLQA